MAEIVKSSGHWLCLRIQDERQPPYTCFIFHSPPTPFLFLSGIKKAHLALVLEAVTLALDCHGCTDLELSGRNLNSLVELAIHQHSQVSELVNEQNNSCTQYMTQLHNNCKTTHVAQGPYSAYRLNKVDPNPLLVVAKRRCQRDLDNENRCVNGLSEEDKRKAANDAFGDNPLPVLEKFTFKVCTVYMYAVCKYTYD